MLRFTRNTVIAFDFKDALSFEGETGPYVQYAIVRAANIFRKANTTEAASLAAIEAIPRSPRRHPQHRRGKQHLGDMAPHLKTNPPHRPVPQHRRARLLSQVRLPASPAIQQLLPPPPHPQRNQPHPQSTLPSHSRCSRARNDKSHSLLGHRNPARHVMKRESRRV